MARAAHRSGRARGLSLSLFVLLALGVWLVVVPGPEVAHAAADASGEFTALSPSRIYDTRDGTGLDGQSTKIQGGRIYDVQVAGRGGTPATGIAAVAVNVTVVQPSAAGWLRVWPSGTAQPAVSNLNFGERQTVANLATVGLGANGKVSVLAPWGVLDLVLDVVGFYATSGGPAGNRFHGVTPFRALDTRVALGGRLGPGATATVDVTGVGGVPANGVAAVAVTVTAVQPTAATWLTVYPADVARPLASNLNPAAGQTVANAAAVRVPVDGTIVVYNWGGSTDVLVDVVGYYDGDRSSEAGRFVPVAPQRLVDTRSGSGALGTQQTDRVALLGADGTSPALVGGVIVNLTAVQSTAVTWLTGYPSDASPALSSNLNLAVGQTVASLVVLQTSAPTSRPAAAVNVFNAAGRVDIVLDLFGVFTDASSPVALAAPSATVEALGAGPPVAVHGDGSLPASARPTDYSAWDGDAGFADGTGIWFLDRLSDGRLVIGSMTPTNSPEAQVVNSMVFGIYTPPAPGVPARFERVDVGRLVRPLGTSTWASWSTISVPAMPIGGGDVSDVCVVRQATADGQMAERVLAISTVPRKFLGEAATVGQYPGVVVIDPTRGEGQRAGGQPHRPRRVRDDQRARRRRPARDLPAVGVMVPSVTAHRVRHLGRQCGHGFAVRDPCDGRRPFDGSPPQQRQRGRDGARPQRRAAEPGDGRRPPDGPGGTAAGPGDLRPR